MQNLEMIGYMLSGGGAALMILLAVRFYAMQARSCVDVTGFLFCVLTAIHMLTDHHTPVADQPLLGQIAVMLGVLDRAVFWVFAQSLFDDKFRIRPLHVLPAVAITATWFLPYGWLLRDVLIIGLMVHVVVIGLRGYQCDLVASRRWLRLALAILVPFMVVTTTISNMFVPVDSHMMAAINAFKFSGLALLFAIWLTRLDASLLEGRMPAQVSDPRPVIVADQLELDRIRREVAGGACFETGLTIGGFAARIDIPEHRLRRLINQGLGYRNFAAFLNDHRIEEAKRRLADPGHAREQILSHAFALGYNSLAPFNRAFKERVGLSPTEYRAAALAQAIA